MKRKAVCGYVDEDIIAELEHEDVLVSSEFSIEEFGKRLLNRRNYLSLTLSELGKAAGITPQAVSNIERGKNKNINIKDIYAFAYALKCSASYLAGFAENINGVIIDGKELKNPIGPAVWDGSTEISEFRKLQREDRNLFDVLLKVAKSDGVIREGATKILSGYFYSHFNEVNLL